MFGLDSGVLTKLLSEVTTLGKTTFTILVLNLFHSFNFFYLEHVDSYSDQSPNEPSVYTLYSSHGKIRKL